MVKTHRSAVLLVFLMATWALPPKLLPNVPAHQQPAPPQPTYLLGTARSAVVKSDVVFNKNNKFDTTPIPFAYISRSGLWKVFAEINSKPDIIIKFHKDVFFIGQEKISLTVFDPEDNGVIYSEERQLLDEQNDVNRLVAHLVARVKTERAVIAVKAAEARGARSAENEKISPAQKQWEDKDLMALNNATQTLSFYAPSSALVESLIEANRHTPSGCHVYLSDARQKDGADVVLEEKIEKGQYTLTLKGRDANEVLHSVTMPLNLSQRAVVSMEKWINSMDWQ